MAHAFDPYYKWLAIPAKDQPPNHYRLLGAELFESDLDVIESAADQRMAHVRSFQTGRNSALSQKILNELAAARVCLLNPEKKARYDAELRAKRTDAPAVAQANEEEQEPFSLVTSSDAVPEIKRRRDAVPRWLVPVGAAALVVLLAAILLVLRGGAKKPPVMPRAADVGQAFQPDARQAGKADLRQRQAGKPDLQQRQAGKPDPQQRQAGKPDLQQRQAGKPDLHSIALARAVEMRFVPVPASADGRVRPFYLGETEVTEAQWAAVMGDEPNESSLPQVRIDHADALTFCERVSALPAAEGRRFRLPTRDEFIRAFGDLSAYSSQQVWSTENGQNQVRAVATRQADARGVFDLVGNVWEWSADGRFYGMSISDSLDRRFLAYSSIPLPPTYQGATADYAGENLGLRLAADDKRPVPAAAPPNESGAKRDPPEPREAKLKRLFSEPLTLPDVSGITADRLLIWNQHHGAANDSGTSELNLTLFAQGKDVWQQPAVRMIWAADQDTFIDLPLPERRFDRLRAEATKVTGQRGGLAEIEIFRGTTNLARGCPAVTAGLVEPQFPPTAVSDGIISQTRTEAEGYWLLPVESTGWVDVDLSFAEPRPCRGVLADRVVVRNQHNGASGDRGTLAFNVALVANGKEVWRREQLELPWSADDDGETTADLPPLRFDRLRVEVTHWQGLGGGLSEVEVWQGDRNLALACPVVASSYHMQRHGAANLTDGIGSSREAGGYWLLPDNTRGWAEIDLSPNDPVIGEANGRLGAYRALVEDNWPLGLAWLARSPDAELRRLARRDMDAGFDARAFSAIGDGWWQMAQLASGQPRERLLKRALRRYAQALPSVSAEDKVRLRGRRDEVLPSLAERHYLYFMEESEARLIEGDAFQLRSLPVVVQGVPSPNGLRLHPPGFGDSWVRFVLPGGYRRFKGAVALNDSARQPASPVTFSVSGDGRTLWTSQPHQQRGESEPFDIDVSGVSSLQLTTTAAGALDWCHAVWIEPRLESTLE